MTLELKAQPLTHEAWAPYGDLITGTDNLSSVPQRVVVNKITHNPILGHKFNRVAPITSLYPSDANAQTTISVIRVGPPAGLTNHDGHSGRFQVRMLEKHIASSQAFVPMQRQPIAFENWTGEPSLPKTDGGGMIVVGCLPKDDGSPDLATLKVFVSSPSQGVSYNAGIWHHSCVSFSHCDYVVIDTQITTDSSLKIDCEIIRNHADEPSFASVELPKLL